MIQEEYKRQSPSHGLSQSARFAAWFAMRPKLYPELARRAVRRISGGRSPKNQTRSEAIAWCEERSVSVDEAVSWLGVSSGRIDLPEQFPREYQFAGAALRDCPVKMGGPGMLSLLYHACESIEAKYVIETGVAYGWSSLAILLSLRDRKPAKLVSIDMPYPGMGNDQHVGCVVPTELRMDWELLRLPDRDGLPKALANDAPLDLCHYDSDKSYEGRVWSYPRLWDRLRPGGLFLSDDIGDNIAFKEFSETRQDHETVIVQDQSHFAGIIRKRADA